MFEIIKIFLCIGICELAGIIGSYFTMPAVRSWYRDIIRPSFAPPKWVFAPVWTLLYCLMGISLYLILNGPFSVQKFIAFGLFAVQLFLNVLWSIVFFGKHSFGGGFVVILLLDLYILLTIISFWTLSKLAALILIPYFLWVSFASVLNFFIYKLNRPVM